MKFVVLLPIITKRYPDLPADARTLCHIAFATSHNKVHSFSERREMYLYFLREDKASFRLFDEYGMETSFLKEPYHEDFTGMKPLQNIILPKLIEHDQGYLTIPFFGLYFENIHSL